MCDLPPEATPTGRDVAAAWVVCVVIGALALGLMGDPHSGEASAPTAAEAAQHRQAAVSIHGRYLANRPGRTAARLGFPASALIPPAPPNANAGSAD